MQFFAMANFPFSRLTLILISILIPAAACAQSDAERIVELEKNLERSNQATEAISTRISNLEAQQVLLPESAAPLYVDDHAQKPGAVLLHGFAEDKGGILPSHLTGLWATGEFMVGDGSLSYDRTWPTRPPSMPTAYST